MDDCEARAGVCTHLRIGMGWGGAVGCGSCSSRGVTATVQMRSAGSVRFMWASSLRVACERAFLFLARLEENQRVSNEYSPKLRNIPTLEIASYRVARVKQDVPCRRTSARLNALVSRDVERRAGL